MERYDLNPRTVRDLIPTIPWDKTLNAGDLQKVVQLGGPKSTFVPMTSAPYLYDLDDVRRAPTLGDAIVEESQNDIACCGRSSSAEDALKDTY